MKVDTSEYKLLEAGDDLVELSLLVTEHMRDGFRPYGEPFIFRSELTNGTAICQAVTKISSETKQELKDGIWQ